MNAEEKNRYFQELTLNLQHEGFAVKPETEEGLLPVELDGQRLCLARASGAVRYRREDAADEHRSAALDSVISIAKTTTECTLFVLDTPCAGRSLGSRQAVACSPPHGSFTPTAVLTEPTPLRDPA